MPILCEYKPSLIALAVKGTEANFGWIILACLLLPLIIGLSRHALLWLCRCVGTESLIGVSAGMLVVSILVTAVAVRPHSARSPKPVPSETAGPVSAHQLLGIPDPEMEVPEAIPMAEEPGWRKLAADDPVGLTLRGSRVFETVVGLVAWIPSCLIDSSNFGDPRWPFQDPWPPLNGVAWWLIPPVSLLCLLGVLYSALVLPPNLVDIRAWAKASFEPPASERQLALAWLIGLLILILLNDAGIIVFPGIVVGYLAWVCFASLSAFREYAIDKAWAIRAMRSRQEAAGRQEEMGLGTMDEGDFIEEVRLDDEESKPSGRVPESTLLFYASIGGWPGALAAQGLLWHKVSNRKEGFRQELAVRIFIHCLAVSLLLCAVTGFYS